ncbi:MAG: imidazole glycerol phosphate synthase subunit HisH [Candidatus Peribacteraceae bacterium]|nr:imidazole glycerol phosphate synthase subunit HisH [Candidatus Peribacteraceae bacterium]
MNSVSPPIGILRYNAGNIGSVQRALARLDIPVQVIETPDQLQDVSGLIFPGAGAANAAMRDLRERGLIESIRSFQKPFLGLCLGMQLLFDFSEEGTTECLGILKGKVKSLPENVIRPHMGWNRLSTGGYAYFVHSYICEPDDPGVITQTVQYGSPICAGVRQKNFFGVQWHPEKSAEAGDQFLLSFAQLCK